MKETICVVITMITLGTLCIAFLVASIRAIISYKTGLGLIFLAMSVLCYMLEMTLGK